MHHYKLLTPGPLTTTDTVKQEMLFDHCTWDADYKQITQRIRGELVRLAGADEEDYTAVLIQGSGTFGVESVLTSAVGKDDTLLICSNGAYGTRMALIADRAGLEYHFISEDYQQPLDPARIAAYMRDHPEITHIAAVHNETTTGVLNDIEAICAVVKGAGRTIIMDAMSSFGGIPMDIPKLQVDFLISSANKCIQGVPGFSFVLARRDAMQRCEGSSRSLSLDLYDQWLGQEQDGKWRFTSPTHAVLAFAKALEELEEAGGIAARYQRYCKNSRMLLERMEALGFASYVEARHQSPIIATFLYPQDLDISFPEFYAYIKQRGYAIYPGKLTQAESFRVGTIGEIYPEDVETLCDIIEGYLEERVGWRK